MIINKVVYGDKGSKCDMCQCPMTELLTNGGFDVFENDFVGWNFVQIPENSFEIGQFLPGYEGPRALSVNVSQGPGIKTLRIFQDVNVTPGCLLQFSFFENLIVIDDSFDRASVTGRVYFGDIELIRIERRLIRANSASEVYSYHHKIANFPVPHGITTVTAEIEFEVEQSVTDNPDLIRWLLDVVSLRNVSPQCICKC